MSASSRGYLAAFLSPRTLLFCIFQCFTLVYGCLPPGGVNSGVTQAQGTFVCIVFSAPAWQEGTSNFSRVAFTPIVDRFTRLQFSDTFSNLTSQGVANLYGPNVAVHVESMGVASFQKLYRQEDSLGRTFSVLTAIINLDRGVVTGITFDNGCPLCDNSDRCVENTYDFTGERYTGVGATSDCFLTDAECAPNAQADRNACQLSLYITWTGTDAQGNFLTSSSRRFSLLSAFSVKSFVNGLVKGVQGVSMREEK